MVLGASALDAPASWVLTLDSVGILAGLVVIDRLYRWLGARPRTRYLVWAVALSGLIASIGGFFLGGALVALEWVLLLLVIGALVFPSVVMWLTGGRRRLVEFGLQVGRAGQAAAAARNAPAAERVVALATARLAAASLERWRAEDTGEFIDRFRLDLETTLAGHPDEANQERLYELSSGFRKELDRAGVGPWSWYWVAAADRRSAIEASRQTT